VLLGFINFKEFYFASYFEVNCLEHKLNVTYHILWSSFGIISIYRKIGHIQWLQNPMTIFMQKLYAQYQIFFAIFENLCVILHFKLAIIYVGIFFNCHDLH